MGLNITTQGGDFDPYCKYNSKAGRWYFKDGQEEVEVQNPVFVADFANIKTGWLLFLEGQAPSNIWDASLTTPAPKPSDKHKRGFEVRLFSKNSFNGVVQLSSSSMHLCNAINDLYVAYEAAPESKKDMLPVVKYTGSTPMKDKMGTNYKPNFVIEKWVTRPAELDGKGSNDQNKVAADASPAPVAASVSEF